MQDFYKSNSAILNEVRDYLDGLILSDGNIQHPFIKTGYYQQVCKEKGWLDKISEDLYEYGIESSVNNGRFCKTNYKPDGSISYKLQIRSYIEFKEMHDRWYKSWYDVDNYPKTRWHKDNDGEYFIWQKVVPKDICLSPVCLANEYLGDGSCPKQTYRNSYQIILATNDFLREDTVFLADLLSDVLDIKCSVSKSGLIIISIQSDISIFLNYIKDYKVDCYAYKFPERAMS